MDEVDRRRVRRPLLQVCDALCESLRLQVGLTTCRIHLIDSMSPRTIVMHSAEPIAWVRPGGGAVRPAHLAFAIRSADRLVANVEIEHAAKIDYPADACATCERIAAEYADQLSSSLETTGS